MNWTRMSPDNPGQYLFRDVPKGIGERTLTIYCHADGYLRSTDDQWIEDLATNEPFTAEWKEIH